MMGSADWVFKMSWLISLLSAWLKISVHLRLSIVMILVTAAILVLFTPSLSRGVEPTPSLLPLPQFSAAATSAAALNRLPDLSSTALYELIHALENPAISQQRENFNINFTAHWPAFAEFTNRIAQTNLAPQSYRLLWQAPLNSSLSGPQQPLKIEFQLSPGSYRGSQAQAITLSDTLPPDPKPTKVGPACQVLTMPAFTVQATWPSRGYIQILTNDRSIRLNIDDLLENSWQLLRIGSESVEFRWHGASSHCPQAESVTVAI